MLKPGDTFGDYRVVKLLGQGGMGAVYLLEDAEGAQVAAKILDPATAGDHESRKRFVREAQLARGVEHPSAVEVYDVARDPDSGLCYILMEYIPGGSLADRIETQGPLPIRHAIRIVYQIASVLELARPRGIVHRDIKPANIMFAADGTPKLADLGIARGGKTGTETTVTQTGMMIGTPAYMAPEQMLDAHNVDTRADIYSLGIVFYEMLTGVRPNKDDTVVQLMAKAMKGERIPDVRKMRPEVPASLAKLLAMMVVPNRASRISTPGEVANALAVLVRGGRLGDAPGVRAVSARRRRRLRRALRRFPWKPMIPVGLLVGIAAAFVLLAPPMETPKPKAAKTVERPVERPVVVRTVVLTNVVERVIERTRIVTNGYANADRMRILENKVEKSGDGGRASVREVKSDADVESVLDEQVEHYFSINKCNLNQALEVLKRCSGDRITFVCDDTVDTSISVNHYVGNMTTGGQHITLRRALEDVCGIVNCKFRVADRKVVLFREPERDVVRTRKDAPDAQPKKEAANANPPVADKVGNDVPPPRDDRVIDMSKIRGQSLVRSLQNATKMMFPGWTMGSDYYGQWKGSAHLSGRGYFSGLYGRTHALSLPVTEGSAPFFFKKKPSNASGLRISVALGSDLEGCELEVRANRKTTVARFRLTEAETWYDFEADFSQFADRIGRLDIVVTALEVKPVDTTSRSWRRRDPCLSFNQMTFMTK